MFRLRRQRQPRKRGDETPPSKTLDYARPGHDDGVDDPRVPFWQDQEGWKELGMAFASEALAYVTLLGLFVFVYWLFNR